MNQDILNPVILLYIGCLVIVTYAGIHGMF